MRDAKGAQRRRRRRLYSLDTSRPLLRIGSTGVDWMKRNRGGFERYTQQNWRWMPFCSVISSFGTATGWLTRQWTLLQGWVVAKWIPFYQSRKFLLPPRRTDQNRTFPPLKPIVAVAGASIFLAFCLYVGNVVVASTPLSRRQYLQRRNGLTGITMDKSVEFSYEELAIATDDFSLNNKIGQGGFGSVYHAELRGEKAAIKKMDMQASKEFLSELKVLNNVHHLNLVRLIGYCVEGSLFLVYEYIEKGDLSQHLHSSRRDPLPWSTRVNIALDSARGLEYIHEYTVPVYIHRDIKSANILIDKNFRGKVADFGLTKLTEYGTASLTSNLAGTFGYMSPEYTQYGKISPKIDVYAFGVVLFELISGMEAVGLVALFKNVLSRPNPREYLHKLVDPRLGDDYPFDSVCKLVELANACTQEEPQLRPSMRSIVVALVSLSSSTEDWDFGSFYENSCSSPSNFWKRMLMKPHVNWRCMALKVTS
ncbi:chitin elicitor receptor kinase 1-like isoform X2 [Quercus lobata]|uniref:chitin elicitor receptor kinase 1-like isoform X2 n=1 Tax=Quercus lobata TaxID=97700 RepID=UPI0012493E45|nr:chitin elicitor receptor kinase 1-like isoform X2 [Quercus lobata]